MGNRKKDEVCVKENVDIMIDDFNKTLAEMNSEEKENRRKVDDSVQAMQEFAKWYEKQ